MSSYTYHCVGLGRMVDGSQRMWFAMNRAEIEQERIKARREGNEIVSWYAQTKTGTRILRGKDSINDADLGIVARLHGCPVCNGEWKRTLKPATETSIAWVRLCPVCNGSGVCRKGHERRWAEWQIREMKKEWRETA